MRLFLTVLAVLCAGAASAAEAPEFSWVDEHGSVVWSARVTDTPVPERDPRPLLARPWYRPLADLEFRRLDGGESQTTADLLGDVVILDFWASWCAPCRYELPRMQAFHESRKERGLTTLAINLKEQPELARQSAVDFGLELPIVEYGAGFEETFGVRKIPTIILVDRDGRIRGRWEAFTEDAENSIYETVDALLDPGDAPLETIAEQVAGEEGLEVRWMREFLATVDAAQVLAADGGTARVMVSVGRQLQVMRPNARTVHLVDATYSAGRLVPSGVADEGSFAVLAYRLGGTKLSRIQLPEETRTEIEAPAALLDAAWIDPADPSAGVLLATMKGLVKIDGEGNAGPLIDVGLVRGIARASGLQDDAAWVALVGADERSWRRFSATLGDLGDREFAGSPWRLEGSGRGGAGALAAAIKTATVGHFFGDPATEQVALASADELVILETATGDEVYRARWAGITGLAAGDTDGDGRDELVVSWGRRVAVLAGD